MLRHPLSLTMELSLACCMISDSRAVRANFSPPCNGREMLLTRHSAQFTTMFVRGLARVRTHTTNPLLTDPPHATSDLGHAASCVRSVQVHVIYCRNNNGGSWGWTRVNSLEHFKHGCVYGWHAVSYCSCIHWTLSKMFKFAKFLCI